MLKKNQHRLITCPQQKASVSSHPSAWRTNNKRIWNWYFDQFSKWAFHLIKLNAKKHIYFSVLMKTQRHTKALMSLPDLKDKRNEKKHTSFQKSFICDFSILPKPSFPNDTRETSLLTALLFSQFVLSSNMENSSHNERLCC
jgi:hypothetical protein